MVLQSDIASIVASVGADATSAAAATAAAADARFLIVCVMPSLCKSVTPYQICSVSSNSLTVK